ncbi:MAG: hypothetical protein AAF799_32400 [Myxococcota bacterium]
MASRRVQRRLVRPKSRECDTPDRFDFPCYYLCSECGWLDHGTAHHPHRHDGSDTTPGACPSCNTTAWIDLGNRSLSQNYRDAEASEDRFAAGHWRRAKLILGAGLGVLATLGIATAVPLIGESGLLLTIVGGLSWMLGTAGIGALMGRRARAHRPPRRWRRPLPGKSVTAESSGSSFTHGVLEAEADLRAPLSGQPCAAWSIRVRSDQGLLLDEQQHAALAVDGRELEGNTAALDLAGHEVYRPNSKSPEFIRFMQRRGLSPHDDSLRIEEAYLRPGVPVALFRHTSPQGRTLMLSQAPRALAA